MSYSKLALCPAIGGAFRPLHECVACDQHREGVGCPNIGQVVPKEFCLQECPHNSGGVCRSQSEVRSAQAEKREPRMVDEVWDSEAPLCALPRRVQLADMRVEV